MNRLTPRFSRQFSFCILTCLALLLTFNPLRAAVIWVEGEKPVKSSVKRHPWWYDKVNRADLSGGDFISNWGDQPGEAEYSLTAPKAGEYDFWTRANPVGAALSYQLNGAMWTPIDLTKGQRDNTNIAADGKPDVRFIAWEHVGKVALKQGVNTIAFRFESKNNNHGMLDCFVLSTDDFEPNGITKPGDNSKPAVADKGDTGWFPFSPKADKFEPTAGFDLRALNEKQAGDGGFIEVKDGQFIHGKTGMPIRFWGIDGPPGTMKDPAELRHCARLLAKYGINLVRIHAGYYNNDGEVQPAEIQHAIQIVEAMKAEGIYTDFSMYWFNFITPKPNTPWLNGYDGKKTPIGALMMNTEFQKKYESWYAALLTTPSKTTGKRLIDEPAVASLEIQNEDSLFFWSFSDHNIPDEEMRMIESAFGEWLIKKHGSIEAATKNWKGLRTPRDNPAEGRMGFRNLWSVFHERAPRDQESMEFLTEYQRDFYSRMIAFLRKTGFKGSITTSGWTTASPEYLGALDKYTNTAGDFIDRHGYFAGDRTGQNSGWALMNNHIYADRSGLRFDAGEPGKPKLFVNPVMDPHYDGKPSMISETSFDRPNRYRSEAPLYYACYGALQGSNGFDFFALDTDRWDVKPGYFMQPWTAMAPSTMGQYPAAALIYREGLIAPGDLVVNLNLKIGDLEKLHATPMPQDASFDELRLKDVPTGTQLKANSVIDPLVHYAGRTNVTFSETGGEPKLENLGAYINRAAQTVTSTTHQLKLDYGKGTLTINAPAAQGVSGNLKEAGPTETKDMSISSDLDLGHIVAVSLDGKRLATSKKILLQVMSEDHPTGYRTEEAAGGMKRIIDIGHNPWVVKDLEGTVKFKRADAATLKVTPLDFNGYPLTAIGSANEIKLSPQTLYYLIE